MIRLEPDCKIFILTVALSFFWISLSGAERYSVASGNWNSTATWSTTSGGSPGASVPAKNDDVFIENGHTVTVSSNYECSYVTFTGASATLTINNPGTLTLKNSVILYKQTNGNSECFLTGTGTLVCISIEVGTAHNPPPANASSSVYTHTFTSRIANLNIILKGNKKNNITINSYVGGTSNLRNGVFNLESGTVYLEGQITTVNSDAGNISTFSMETGSQAGNLLLKGKLSSFALSGTGTNSINLNGSSSLVNYILSGAQVVLGTAYNNLTLSGSGSKTLTGVTVNDTLSIEGTASATGTTPLFDIQSTLQYKGSAAQITGVEFPSVFTGSGGIVIDNNSGVTLNSNRTIDKKLVFINGRINTLANTLILSSQAEVTGAGTGRYVNGLLRKGVATGTLSKTFEIGDATVYAPVTLTFSGTINTEGSITAKTTNGDHPNLGSSTFNAGVTVNRYWTLSNSGVAGYISYNATFNYVPGDIDAGADYNYFYIGNYNLPAWIYPSTGTLSPTSTQAVGLSSFGDFQIGELPVASYRTRQSGNWNQVATWETFSGTEWVNATSTPTYSAGYIIIRSSHFVTVTETVSADQIIIDTGGRLLLNSDINVNDGSAYDLTVNGTLECSQGNVTGAGSFVINGLAELIITSPDGITHSDASGNIQAATRLFNNWANYIYSGTLSQSTGNGLPESVNNLVINNSSGVNLTRPVKINGSLILSLGEFNIGTNILTFNTSDAPIIRTAGTISTTPGTDIVFGSPADTTGASFTIPQGTFTSSPEINNLTTYRANGITLNEQLLSVNGKVLCNGPLNTSDNLILLSTPAGTALIDGSGTAEITGNVTMQRYLPSGFGYKYFSSPFQAATVNEFSDNMDLDALFPAFYRFDENRYVSGTPVSGWISYNERTNSLVPMNGYAVHFGSSSAPNTVDVAGVVNNGPVSVYLSNNNNPFTEGFNLVGNPYPSPIDWDADSGWTKINIDDAIYFFSASATDEYGGFYSSYVNGISSEDGLATNIIPSMQGFFVHVSDGAYPVNGILETDNAVRVTDLTHSFVKGEKKNEKSLIRVGASFDDGYGREDFLVTYFDEKASVNFDSQLDALKLMNTDYDAVSIFSIDPDNKKLSINSIPLIYDDSVQVPLGLRVNRDGYVVFFIREAVKDFAEMKISIFDAATGKGYELNGNKKYRVFLSEDEYLNRFFLNLSSTATNIPKTDPEIEPWHVYFSRGTIIADINLNLNNRGRLDVYNMTGQKVMLENIYGDGHYIFSANLANGIYIVTLTSGSYRNSKKIFIQNR